MHRARKSLLSFGSGGEYYGREIGAHMFLIIRRLEV